jgi:hypothetical protein
MTLCPYKGRTTILRSDYYKHERFCKLDKPSPAKTGILGFPEWWLPLFRGKGSLPDFHVLRDFVPSWNTGRFWTSTDILIRCIYQLVLLKKSGGFAGHEHRNL